MLVAQAETEEDFGRVVLGMDFAESPVHGQQGSSAYNGYFESTCYRPLLLFGQHGGCLAAKLPPGNGTQHRSARHRQQCTEAVHRGCDRAVAELAFPGRKVIP